MLPFRARGRKGILVSPWIFVKSLPQELPAWTTVKR